MYKRQRLLTAGLSDTGIICCDGYDEELIDRCYRACDHLSLVVTLYSNGTINKDCLLYTSCGRTMFAPTITRLQMGYTAG